MKKKELEDCIASMHKKFDDLVWYARKSPDALTDGHPSMPGIVRIRMAMPEEVAKLSGPDAQWHHGFNSGAMAAFRMVLGMLDKRPSMRQFAIDSFPDLDT